MNKIYSILFLLLPLFVVAQEKVVYDDNVVERKVPAFHSIRVNSAIKLYLTKSAEQVVVVSSSNRAAVDQLTTVVKDGVLYIGYKDFKWSTNVKLNAYVSYNQLKSLQADGATTVEFVDLLEQEDFELISSGASDVNMNVTVKNLTVKLSGASKVKALGNAESARFSVSGASSFKGYGLSINHTMVSATGASHIEIQNNKEINVAATGASSIKWKGTGVLNTSSVTGASSVKKVQ